MKVLFLIFERKTAKLALRVLRQRFTRKLAKMVSIFDRISFDCKISKGFITNEFHSQPGTIV
jgi:hypothetical protein